ncbi:MAG: hypothetical protein LW817_07830 [Candidatus Caenarcaniphilales bacterium]|jgi:hypothetical protein|nr:hypothetical protein [Candidatus Caenarcaniphilales bacterium]
MAFEIPGLNFIGQMNSLLRSTTQGAVEEALSKVIPNFNTIRPTITQWLAKSHQRLLGQRMAGNSVDEKEIQTSYKILKSSFGNSLSPISFVKNLLRSIFGVSKTQRAVNELGNLKSYADMYDAHKHVNQTLEFLLKSLRERISQREGLFSKLGLKLNSKITQDPVITNIKESMGSWLNVFTNLLHGGVEEIGFSTGDWRFVNWIRDELRNGSKSVYTQDLADAAEKIIEQANKVWQKSRPQQESQALNSLSHSNDPGARQLAEMLSQAA